MDVVPEVGAASYQIAKHVSVLLHQRYDQAKELTLLMNKVLVLLSSVKRFKLLMTRLHQERSE
jgi:hypothetical protein